MAKRTRRQRGGEDDLVVDFTGVESGGGRSLPDGDYDFVVDEVTEEIGESSDEPYLKWVLKVASGSHRGVKVWENTSLQPQALWKLRGLLEAMGHQVDGKFTLRPLSQFDGEALRCRIENEEYNGKQKPRVAEYLRSGGEEEKSEETGPPKRRARSAAAEEDEIDDRLRVGQKVSFEEDGKSYKGVLTSLDGDEATVEVDGEEWVVAVDDLTAR